MHTGPFAWGPVIGGEGVRAANSIPRVDLFASIHRSSKYQALHDKEFQTKEPVAPGAQASDSLGHTDSSQAKPHAKGTEIKTESMRSPLLYYYFF